MSSRATGIEVVDGEVRVTVEHEPRDSYSRSVIPAAWQHVIRNAHLVQPALEPMGGLFSQVLTRARIDMTETGSVVVWVKAADSLPSGG